MAVYKFAFPVAAAGAEVTVVDHDGTEVDSGTLGSSPDDSGSIVYHATLDEGDYIASVPSPRVRTTVVRGGETEPVALLTAHGVLDVVDSIAVVGLPAGGMLGDMVVKTGAEDVDVDWLPIAPPKTGPGFAFIYDDDQIVSGNKTLPLFQMGFNGWEQDAETGLITVGTDLVPGWYALYAEVATIPEPTTGNITRGLMQVTVDSNGQRAETIATFHPGMVSNMRKLTLVGSLALQVGSTVEMAAWIEDVATGDRIAFTPTYADIEFNRFL